MKVKVLEKPPEWVKVKCPNCKDRFEVRGYGTVRCPNCNAKLSVKK